MWLAGHIVYLFITLFIMKLKSTLTSLYFVDFSMLVSVWFMFRRRPLHSRTFQRCRGRINHNLARPRTNLLRNISLMPAITQVLVITYVHPTSVQWTKPVSQFHYLVRFTDSVVLPVSCKNLKKTFLNVATYCATKLGSEYNIVLCNCKIVLSMPGIRWKRAINLPFM